MKILLAILISLTGMSAMNSCKKCTTCVARDSATNEIKFQEKGCSKGPLLNEWREGFKRSYPPPLYNTTCD